MFCCMQPYLQINPWRKGGLFPKEQGLQLESMLLVLPQVGSKELNLSSVLLFWACFLYRWVRWALTSLWLPGSGERGDAVPARKRLGRGEPWKAC